MPIATSCHRFLSNKNIEDRNNKPKEPMAISNLTKNKNEHEKDNVIKNNNLIKNDNFLVLDKYKKMKRDMAIR